MENIEELSQEKLRRMLFEGGTFIFLKVPKETAFGIDMKEWNVDENFKGIKMIPAGLHFIHYSAVCNLSGAASPRTGFFYNFKKSEFLVRYWDEKTEDISETPVNEEEVTRQKQNFLNLEKFLGAYPYDVYNKWLALTDYISEELAEVLSPSSKVVRSALTLEPCNDSERPRGVISHDKGESSKNIETDTVAKRRKWYDGQLSFDSLLPDLKPVAGTELRFTKFPERNYPDGSTPAEITKHSLDSSYVLDVILNRHKSVRDFIGEVQFSFVTFLVGHSLEAFEHWKNLIGLLCSCENAITKHREVYDLLVPVLEAQLKEIPEEFLADIVTNNNFVYCKLRNLFRAVQESNVDGRLKTKMVRFKESLSEKYNWDFGNLEMDEDDEAPVIVEM